METVYAWLVVNGFLQSDKFRQLFDWLVQAADRQGCRLEVHTNTELLPALVMGKEELLYGFRRPQFVIFWDKDIRLARLLEKAGLRLFNCADSIEICDDKSRTFLELLGSGIRMPKTVIAPKTFRPHGYAQFDFLLEAERQLGFPMVLKECYGSFGQQVFLISDHDMLVKQLQKTGNRPCLLQEYLASSAGHDIRIQMVGKRPVAAMYRYNDNDFRANITNGGSMKAYEPDGALTETAQKIMRILNLDFAGIDFLFGENNEPVLCEVNSNAHFINIWECTGVNTADAIIKHVLRADEYFKKAGI